MDVSILNALVKMIETGGVFTLWGIFLYKVLCVLNTFIIGLFVFLIAKHVSNSMISKWKN